MIACITKITLLSRWDNKDTNSSYWNQLLDQILLRAKKCQIVAYFLCTNKKFMRILALVVCRITGNILAMARPNSQVIEKYDVIENFKK